MAQQKHIVNKQILEIHLPSSADTFAVQQKLSALCRQQLTTAMDRLFSSMSGTGDQPLQIEQLTVDLGQVSLQDFETVFEEKLQESFQEKLLENRQSRYEEQYETTTPVEKIPIRAIAYYLKNGMVPWWAQEVSKTFVQEQLAQLLRAPSHTFIRLLKQLRWNPQYLERFVYTGTEPQLLKALQLLSEISVQNITDTRKKLQQRIQKNGITAQEIKLTFWKTAFQKIHTTQTYASFEKECIQHTQRTLGIDQKKPNSKKNTYHIQEIGALLALYITKYPNNTIWKDFFKQVSAIMAHPLLEQLPTKMLHGCKQLLQDLENKLVPSLQNEAVTELLKPIASYMQAVQKQLQQLSTEPITDEIERLSSPFEETDFIPIQNAGLVLFWPFLVRFFENLALIQDKSFTNATARHTAVCALQYLCDGDQELFEGTMSLSKILCGLELEEVVLPTALSAEEKEIAEGLLTAVIAQGPHWTNLSIEGFRAKYLCRSGSLRTRDGHWLLQVARETHDIILEKLPWGFHTVKLPWMPEIIVVEWL